MVKLTDRIIDLSAEASGLSLAGKIAEGLAREIRRGRFAPGARLPSSRKLSVQLGVHRNTVLAALGDLLAQGYVRTEPGRGVFVSERSAAPQVSGLRPREQKSPVDFPLSPQLPRESGLTVGPGDLPLLGGLPDLRLSPVAELARAQRRALADARVTLDYASERGEPRFLKAFRQFLAETRGVVTDEGGLMTTRGSQQALYLAARVLLRPGQTIAVEALGYPPAWEAFRLAGARLAPVRVDRGGIDLARLEQLAETEDLAAVYVTPHHQYPTTVTMSGPRRTQLLRLARRKQFFVIEDDYDHEFHFEGRPVLPLASFDLSALVIHVGTFSKVFAPGLRLGYVAAQPRIVDAMCRVRRVLDRQGDHPMERALAELIEDGLFAAHLRRMHRTYAERREVLLEELETRLADRLAFQRPSGGLAVWARVLSPSGKRAGRAVSGGKLADHWAEAARKAGVLVQPARMLAFDGRSREFLRLGFPRLNPEELVRATRRLSDAFPGRAC